MTLYFQTQRATKTWHVMDPRRAEVMGVCGVGLAKSPDHYGTTSAPPAGALICPDCKGVSR